MTDLILLVIFFLGAAVGSFLGVIVDRFPKGEPITKGRSHCDHCRHKLGASDLIPLVSFFLLKRKCRYCHAPLSWFYPIIEAITGFVFVILATVIFQDSLTYFADLNYLFLFLFYAVLSSILLTIFFIDIKFGLIPFKIVLTALGLTLLWYMLFPTLYFSENELSVLGLQTNILIGVGAGLGAGLFFFAIFLLTKGRGMGFGDVVYAALMGFILGFPNVLLGLYIAFITGAVVSLILIFLKKKKLRGDTIPFGPFLVLGTLISLLWGTMIVDMIISYLFF